MDRDVWTTDFIQVPVSWGCERVLVVVWMFSRWTEARSCEQTNVPSEAGALSGKLLPTGRQPHSHGGTRRTGQRFDKPVLLGHCGFPVYRPPPSG